MLNIRPPDRPARSWKDFFVQIATIAIGLLLAIGLEQGAEYLHHNRQVATLREELIIERRINANRFAVATDEFRRFVPKLQTNLAIFQYLSKHPGAPPEQWPGKLDWLAQSSAFTDSVWKIASESGVLQFMPPAEVKIYDELYERLHRLGDIFRDEQTALNQARRFAIQDPDPAHLSIGQLERQIDLTSQVLLHYALAGRAQNNLHGRFPDFQPSLTRDDVYGILHATTDPEDQRILDGFNERIQQFEQQYGINMTDPVPSEPATHQHP